jgi:hypothetical protein
MPAERCYIGVMLNGADQFYQRNTERKGKNGRFEAVPFFVLKRSDAVVMSEEPTVSHPFGRLFLFLSSAGPRSCVGRSRYVHSAPI